SDVMSPSVTLDTCRLVNDSTDTSTFPSRAAPPAPGALAIVPAMTVPATGSTIARSSSYHDHAALSLNRMRLPATSSIARAVPGTHAAAIATTIHPRRVAIDKRVI